MLYKVVRIVTITNMNNKTSLAVNQMAKGDVSIIMSRYRRVAIAKKFQKMEEALKIVSAGIWRDKKMNACGLAGEAVAVHAVEEALSFDPLK